MTQTTVPSTHLLKEHTKFTSILYNVNTMAYVVDWAFSLSTYIMDRVLVLNMWWVGFWTYVGFININMSCCSL